MKVTVLCSVQCKTYACVLEGHLMGLTIDFSTGFICFDAATKVGYPISLSMRQASCTENNWNCFQRLSAGCLVIRCQTSFIGDKLCLNLLIEKSLNFNKTNVLPQNITTIWSVCTGVGSHSLLQRIFPTQGLNLSLLHCRQILYCLSHKGSPIYTCISMYYI